MARFFHMGTKLPASRIKAVFDLMEKNEIKLALKQMKQMLDKQPADLYGQALKAMILLRNDEKEEALSIARRVKSSNGLESEAIEILMQVFREAHEEKEAIEVCEVAWKLNPTNEDLGVEVFGAVLQSHDYIKAQQVAMKLWKQSNKRLYYFWAVIALSLQVSGTGPNRVLSLAEMMVTKMVPSGDGVEVEELRLLLGIVAQQHAWDRAIELIGSWIPQRSVPEHLYWLRIEAEILWRIGRIDEAAKVYYSLLETVPDDWRVLSGWIESTLGLTWQNQGVSDVNMLSPALQQPTQPQPPTTIPTLYPTDDLLEKIKSHQAQHSALRGPYLAEMHLFSLLKDTEQLWACTITYKAKFGKKETCYSDLQPYISLLNGIDLVNKFDEMDLDIHLDNLKSTAADIADAVSHYTTTIKCRIQCSTVDDSSIAIALKRYLDIASKHNIGGSIAVYESILTSMAVGIARMMITVDPSEIGVHRLLSLLEYDRRVWTGSDSSLDRLSGHHSGLLMMIPCYLHLGAYTPCVKLFSRLSVRNIMAESMSYAVFDAAARTPGEDARIHHNECIRVLRALHMENVSVSSRLLLLPFDNAAYSRAGEVASFHRNLRRSALLVGTDVEQYLTPLIRGLHSADKYSSDTSVKRGVGLAQLDKWATATVDDPSDDFDYLYQLTRHDDTTVLPPEVLPFYSNAVSRTSVALHNTDELRALIKARASLARVLVTFVVKNCAGTGLAANLVKNVECVTNKSQVDSVCWDVMIKASSVTEWLMEGNDPHVDMLKYMEQLCGILNEIDVLIKTPKYCDGWLRECTAVMEALAFATMLIPRWKLPGKKSKKIQKSPWKEVRVGVVAAREALIDVYSRIETIMSEEVDRLKGASVVVEVESAIQSDCDGVVKAVRDARLESVEWLRFIAEAKKKCL